MCNFPIQYPSFIWFLDQPWMYVLLPWLIGIKNLQLKCSCDDAKHLAVSVLFRQLLLFLYDVFLSIRVCGLCLKASAWACFRLTVQLKIWVTCVCHLWLILIEVNHPFLSCITACFSQVNYRTTNFDLCDFSSRFWAYCFCSCSWFAW